MQSELISVIIPIYKVEKYLERCVSSVLAQTYRNMEIILVDDGSPDSCGAMCDAYAKKDARIRVLHKKNGGLSDARNTGLELCGGGYVAFIDSDDFVAPRFIESLHEAAVRFDADIVTTRTSYRFQDGEDEDAILRHLVEKAKEPACQGNRLREKNEILEEMFYQKIPTGAPFRLYRRALLDEIRFPVGYYYEDLATTYRAFLQAERIAETDEIQYAYRVRAASITTETFSEKKMVIIPITKKVYADIMAFDPSLETAVCSRLFAVNNHVFLQIPKDDKANQKLIWNEIKKYRKNVVFDHHPLIRPKNRVMAFLSYGGMGFAWRMGRIYLRLRKPA